MAEVLRLQKKPARDIKRYLDAARGKLDVKADPQLAREIALADALVLARDGKLADARDAFAVIDQGEGKMETSGDVRARFHEALALAAGCKAGDAKPLVDTILAAQAEHAGGTRARREARRRRSRPADPLPPEDGRDAGVAGVGPHPGSNAPIGPGPGSASVPTQGSAGRKARRAPVEVAPHDNGHEPAVDNGGGGDYDKLVAKANALAESNCESAIKMYQNALAAKPNGVEALTGMGYCHIDAKQFASAFSKFPRGARGVTAQRTRAVGHRRGVSTAGPQGRRDHVVQGVPRSLSG